MSWTSWSAVSSTECGKSARSTGPNSGPKSWSIHPSCTPLPAASAPSAIRDSSATQGSESSRMFQIGAKTPPGLTTRAISRCARSGSNQWYDCPATTASTEASGTGIASPLPASAVTPGVEWDSRRRIASSGSTGTTSWPRLSATRVRMPVPAPRSITRRGAEPSAHSRAAGGYVGRIWSYSSAARPKDRAESSGQCITTISQQLFEFLRRRFPSERFPWPPIELIGDLVQVKLIVRGKVGSFRKVLAEQAVGVLVATALPRRVRVAEEHRNVGGYGELGVRGHLDALVPGQRPSQRFG